MDKQNVVDAYSGILFSFKKKGNSDTCYMDEPEDTMMNEAGQSQKEKY